MAFTTARYPLPDLCGPEHVADLIVWLRSRRQSEVASPISEAGIRKLVSLAFNLSLSPEEGRYPRLCLANQQRYDQFLAIRFDSPIELHGIGELRRLAPACANPDFALLITEENDILHCMGLTNIGPQGLNSKPGRPETVPVGGPPSLRVWIEGPGHLLIEDIIASFELRAGEIRQIVPFLAVPAIRQFLNQTSEDLCEQVISLEGADGQASKYFGGNLSSLVRETLERLAFSCFTLGQGGAFIILPNSESMPSDFDIRRTRLSSNLDLGQDMVQFWVQCIRVARTKDKSEFQDKLVGWNQAKARLIVNTEAASSLSAIDGCVIFNNRLRVLGFGGFIDISDKEAQRTTRTFKLKTDGKAVSYREFMDSVGGARHQSASRLCTKHLGTIAIVISQDRQLQVFCSDADGHVRRYGPLDPYGWSGARST